MKPLSLSFVILLCGCAAQPVKPPAIPSVITVTTPCPIPPTVPAELTQAYPADSLTTLLTLTKKD
jgi:hypothetical protein